MTRGEQRRLISLSIWQMNDWEDHILRSVLAKQLTGDLTITMWIVKCLLLLYQCCVVVLLWCRLWGFVLYEKGLEGESQLKTHFLHFQLLIDRKWWLCPYMDMVLKVSCDWQHNWEEKKRDGEWKRNWKIPEIEYKQDRMKLIILKPCSKLEKE